jgi:EAL domain-containing protein (putative c-di-GMP-specific phosphodiesterase class I)
VTASIGLVAIDAASVSAATALAAGDAACHVARDRGGNRLHEHSPGDSAVAQRHGQMRWVARLNEALAKGHFALWAQAIHSFGPVADPPVLWELLLRLRDERGELVTPQAFVPAAERYHLMAAIDRWVVKRTLEILSRRAPASDAAVYAVNLSGQSVGDEGFLPFVAEALRSSGVPPSCLCFEITETAAIETLAQATRFIEVLQGLGCRFALDDFGIGFSSFDYLRSMTFDFVKIDGSFVRHLEDPLQQAIVRCVNQVCHLTGRRTIAEWIEDERAATLLREIGVDYGQGWYIARPVPFGVPE